MVNTGVPKPLAWPVGFPEPRSPAYAPVASRTTQLPASVVTEPNVVGWFGGENLSVHRSVSVPLLPLYVRTCWSTPMPAEGTAPNRAWSVTVPVSETVPEAENVPLKVPTNGAVLETWERGNGIVDVVVSEPDARAAPGANANTPATATNKATARPRPCANNEPNPRALLTIIEITPDPKNAVAPMATLLVPIGWPHAHPVGTPNLTHAHGVRQAT